MIGVNMNHLCPFTVTAFQKHCCNKSGLCAMLFGGGCWPGVVVHPVLLGWASPATLEAAVQFIPWLPVDYCLNQGSPASEMVFHCSVSACPQGAILQLPVFISPALPVGTTTIAGVSKHFPGAVKRKSQGTMEWLGGKKQQQNFFLSTGLFL